MPSCFFAVLVGADQQEDPVGVHRQRGPDLLAVDDVVVAVQHRLGPQRGEVGAGVGLGIALAPDMLAGQDLRQEALLLRLGAVLDQQRAEHDDAVVVGAGDAVALVFLGEDDLLGRRQAEPAIFLRPARAEPALLGQRHVPGLVLGPVQALRRVAQILRVVLVQEGAHHVAEMLVVQASSSAGGGMRMASISGSLELRRALAEEGVAAFAKSSVRNSVAWKWRSCSSARSRPSPSICLVSAIGAGACSARNCAFSSAVASAWPFGTTWSTRPMRSASGALIWPW